MCYLCTCTVGGIDQSAALLVFVHAQNVPEQTIVQDCVNPVNSSELTQLCESGRKAKWARYIFWEVPPPCTLTGGQRMGSETAAEKL